MANSSDTPILNPFTPMAFLSPDEAYQKTITEYVIVGGLSVSAHAVMVAHLVYLKRYSRS